MSPKDRRLPAMTGNGGDHVRVHPFRAHPDGSGRESGTSSTPTTLTSRYAVQRLPLPVGSGDSQVTAPPGGVLMAENLEALIVFVSGSLALLTIRITVLLLGRDATRAERNPEPEPGVAADVQSSAAAPAQAAYDLEPTGVVHVQHQARAGRL
jgi:hypothetical protein